MGGATYLPYVDADLTFCLQAFNDVPLVRWSLSHLRGLYPGSRIIVVSDGDTSLEVDFDGLNVDFRAGERLYLIEKGGAAFDRNFGIFLERPTKWLFKIDSDVGWHKRFGRLPEEGIFGTIQENAVGMISLQGGCYGLTLEVVQTIVNSGILKDGILTNAEATYAIAETEKDFCRKTGSIPEDWMLGWIANRLGIPMKDYPEIHSKWREYTDNSGGWFSVTHPCKNFHL